MTMIYNGSKGPVEISTMNGKHAATAAAKLRRTEPSRTAEIAALEEHAEKMAAGYEAGQGDTDANPRAIVGGNNPPPDEAPAVSTGREAIEAHADDLLTEAANWADGVAIESDGQAEAAGKLYRDLQAAASLVDDNAAKEKKPHNDAVNEIGAWQNGYTAKGLKKTPDGKLTKAIAALGRLSAAWLQKLDDERRAREKVAADAALAAAQEAMALREEAKETTDLAVMDRAEDALADAKALLRQAEVVAKEKPRVAVGEGQRAVTLRTIYHARLIDAPGSWGAAYGHYKQIPEFMAEFHALIQRWADRDAKSEAARLRGVPGFTFFEEKVV